jgi:hypothetical protein
MKAEHSQDALPQRPIKTLCVAVDACAELSSQPYRVLEALHDLYALNQKRRLLVVDTEQGFHEKANGTTPAILKAANLRVSPYGQFVQRNPEWVKVIPTQVCEGFKDALAQDIFPSMVMPMLETTEHLSQMIRQKAFALMQQQGLHTLDGKKIESADDIEIRIDYHPNTSEGKSHYSFHNDLIRAAADREVKKCWKDAMEKNETVSRKHEEIRHKGSMVAMIKAQQELKAYSYTLLSQFHPKLAKKMGSPPPHADSSFPAVREHSYLYDHMHLPDYPQFMRMPEFIQSVRLTQLWPWSQKPHLKSACSDRLRKLHKDTADVSYVYLCANELHKHCAPEESLFLLLTHDGPLADSLRHYSRGYTRPQHKDDGVMTDNPFYERTDLNTKRSQYPLAEACAGEQFVQFAYKEALDELGYYIKEGERSSLFEDISAHDYQERNIGRRMLKHIDKAKMGFELKTTLQTLVSQIMALEPIVERNLKGHKHTVDKGVRYDILQEKETHGRG